ncbi:hypothetical protein HDC32_001687 [Pseudomonas sp. JAI120]|nr:hypothetical protein [Pseudomonas sp. SJZ073]MBB6312018.1 hypothetical protein [Pseudomonas sp. JAI120]
MFPWRPSGRPLFGVWVSTYPLLRSRRLWVTPLRRVTLEKPQSNQRALAPPLGTSPRLGMPERRLESVGRRPAGLPTDSSLRSASVVNGAPRIKIKSQNKSRTKAEQKQSKSRAKAEQKQAEVYLLDGDPNVGGGLPPIAVSQSTQVSLTHPHRGQAPSHIFNPVHQTKNRTALRPPRFGF